MNNNKLTAKDFITIGIFTTILFVVESACGMLGYIHPYVVAAYVVIIPIVGSIPMMLFFTKVEKFGMITIMSILIAIIMFVTGMGYLGAPLIVVVGVLADFIAKSGNYKSFKKIAISYGVFSVWVCANFFPVIVTAKDYRENLIKAGYSVEYCDYLFKAINSKTIAFLVLVCFICGVIGAILGKATVKKHFEKAGIV